MKKLRLNDNEIEKIVDTFQRKETVDDFSVAVTYDEIKEKDYSLSAGQYLILRLIMWILAKKSLINVWKIINKH